MMGYTHLVIGSGGALVIALLCGANMPDAYLISSVAGALGGVVIDSDARDHFSNPKVTDAGRTRLATIGLLLVGIGLDVFLSIGVLNAIISRGLFALFGIIAFLITAIIGYFTPHRTFTHSLLFVIITSVCVYFVYPAAVLYFLIGSILHLLFDMLNYPYKQHGVWLLFPLKTGKGIALGVCKSARTGNKVCYFIGLFVFIAGSALFLWRMGDPIKFIAPTVVFTYSIIVLHFVRWKSEKEQRHIMHMRGEI